VNPLFLLQWPVGEGKSFYLFSEINRVNLLLMFESLLAAFLLGSFLERRSHFYLRAVSSSLLFMALAYFLPTYYDHNSLAMDLLSWFLLYLFLLAMILVPLVFCYKGKFVHFGSIATTSYAIHQLFSMLFTAILSLVKDYTNFATAYPIGYQVFYWCFYFLLLGSVYGGIFALYFRQRKDILEFNFSRWQTLALTLTTVVSAILLSALQMLLANFKNYEGLVELTYFVDVFECALILTLFFHFVFQNHLKDELEVEKKLLEESKKQYELSKENIESLNLKIHDFKYRLMALDAGMADKKDFQEIYKDLAVYDAQVKTGNDALDVVIREYALRCENNGITFTSVVDGKSLSFMAPYDIYALFGNAINNAIEAVSKIQEKEKRNISLIVRRQNGFLSIHEVNYFEGTLDFDPKTGLPKTSKDDKLSHGYGLKSIRLIAEKYGGEATYSVEGDVFLLDALLPIPAGK